MYDAIRRGEAIPEDLLHGQGYDRLPGHQGFTPLSFAAQCCNLPATRQLLDRFQPDLNRPDENGHLPLELAAGAGHAGVTQALLAAGADPALPAHDGRPVIHHAVDSGSVDTTLALVDAGGDDVLLAADGRGYRPLDRAVEVSHPEIVTALCRAGAADRYRVPDGGRRAEPPGLAAARIGDPSVLAALHGTGALALPSMSRNAAGDTPLHAAAEADRNAAAAYLLSIGSPVNAANTHGATPLHRALMTDHLDVTQTLLLQGNADPNVMGPGGTPLHAAVIRSHVPAVTLLLRSGADPHIANRRGTPLHLAARLGDTPTAQALMASGVDPLQQTAPDEPSPLRSAVESGDEAMIGAMVQRVAQMHGGAVPPGLLDNTDWQRGSSLLHSAAAHPDPAEAAAMCSALMRGGADPNVATGEGKTPLHMAAQIHMDRPRSRFPRSAADTEVFRALVAGGADPDRRDHQGRTAADRLQAGGADPAVVAAAREPAPPVHHAPGAGDAQASGPPAPAPHYTAVMAAAGGAGGTAAGAAPASRPPTPTHGM